MPCNIAAGYSVSCKDYIGGIKNIYFGALSDFASGVVEASGVVTTLPGTAGSINIYKYEVKKGTGSYTDKPVADSVAHTVYFEQTATAFFPTLVATAGNASERLDFEAIARGRWIVFVQDSNDNIFMAGLVNGAEVSDGDWTTGTAIGDANGYNLTLTAQEQSPAPILSDFTTEPFDNFTGITVV